MKKRLWKFLNYFFQTLVAVQLPLILVIAYPAVLCLAAAEKCREWGGIEEFGPNFDPTGRLRRKPFTDKV